MSDQESARLIILKIHYMVYNRAGSPYQLRPNPNEEGFYIIEVADPASFLDAGDRLLKVQNQVTRGLSYQQVLALMVPNANTGEILLIFAKGPGLIPNRVKICQYYQTIQLSVLSRAHLDWSCSTHNWEVFDLSY